MRPLEFLLFLVGCAVPPAPAADGGLVNDAGPLGDSSVLVDSGSDTGIPPSDAPQDTGVGEDAAVSDDAAVPPPVHLDRYEVSHAELVNFRAAGSPEATVDIPGVGLVASGPTTAPAAMAGCTVGGSAPANCLTWGEAFALCAWLGRRMPTRAEWLAESGAPGDEVVHTSAPADVIRLDPHPCPSDQPVCDAHGNVAEWVVDGGDVVLGEAFDSDVPERVQSYASSDVGARCWGAAR